MKAFTSITLLALISTATALPTWFGESPNADAEAHLFKRGFPSYQNTTSSLTPLDPSSSFELSSTLTPTSTTSVSSGVYTLPYVPDTTTSSHSFVYETTLYGPTGPHTHTPFPTPKIYTDY